ncbi:hypothetical protein EV2_000031 [Malus domestica]
MLFPTLGSLNLVEWIDISPIINLPISARITLAQTIHARPIITEAILVEEFTYNHRGHFGRRIYCQLCQEYDHEAIQCPQGMNPNFGIKSSQSAMCASAKSSQSILLLSFLIQVLVLT